MTAWIHSSENLFLYDNVLFSNGLGVKQDIRQIKLQNYYFINACIGLGEAFRICQPSYMMQKYSSTSLKDACVERRLHRMHNLLGFEVFSSEAHVHTIIQL